MKTFISIMAEENYLFQKEYVEGGFITYEADNKLKLKYLNKEPFDEISLDYNNYLEWKDTEQRSSWTLFLDQYGQSSFI